MVLDMKENGMRIQIKGMVEDTKSGLMDHSMKDTGKTTRQTAEED